ncbi:uncharacterized protein KGF55_003528 [Candida pseudojiufengensis]|uniref:uncharacterized protein n=1 Tax=Candida pseudojiufengensis TaxID=497109 RepID=UPI00222579EF|nr:uncharacterized protein KGF55_003528 [Candida pseudojiufengensis]KAI5962452.1 hypothetical protein KGF55_003528 [Candida pseudojiufengensis]
MDDHSRLDLFTTYTQNSTQPKKKRIYGVRNLKSFLNLPSSKNVKENYDENDVLLSMSLKNIEKTVRTDLLKKLMEKDIAALTELGPSSIGTLMKQSREGEVIYNTNIESGKYPLTALVVSKEFLDKVEDFVGGSLTQEISDTVDELEKTMTIQEIYDIEKHPKDHWVKQRIIDISFNYNDKSYLFICIYNSAKSVWAKKKILKTIDILYKNHPNEIKIMVGDFNHGNDANNNMPKSGAAYDVVWKSFLETANCLDIGKKFDNWFPTNFHGTTSRDIDKVIVENHFYQNLVSIDLSFDDWGSHAAINAVFADNAIEEEFTMSSVNHESIQYLKPKGHSALIKKRLVRMESIKQVLVKKKMSLKLLV